MIKVRDFKVILENLSGAQVLAKYNPDHIINAGLYDNQTGRNMTFLTANGINDGAYFSRKGIGFKDGKVIWCTQGEATEFIGGSPVILEAGQKIIDWGNQVSSYLQGSHIRSWAGLKKNGELIINVTDRKMTLEELQDEALKYGAYHAINLDGGSSRYLQISNRIVINTGKRNESWILVWGDIMKNNVDLVVHSIGALLEGWAYVWGTWGKVLTEQDLKFKAVQYPNVFDEGRIAYIRKYHMGKRTADCGGLIKSYLWWTGAGPVYTPATDVTVDMMYNQATVKGTIDTIPDVPGIIVWFKGHAGVYTGDRAVIEARGTTYGVVNTEIDKRPWTHWFQHKDILYKTIAEPKPDQDEADTADWAKTARRWVIDNNISDGTRPKDVVTRQELWTMIHRKEMM